MNAVGRTFAADNIFDTSDPVLLDNRQTLNENIWTAARLNELVTVISEVGVGETLLSKQTPVLQRKTQSNTRTSTLVLG